MSSLQQYLKTSEDLLHKRGYRMTPQRYLILHVFGEIGGHLTIDELTRQVQLRNPQVNLSTIYRNLDLLLQLGLLRTNYLPGEALTYEMATGTPHHHFVCKQCRTVMHLEEMRLHVPEDLQKQLWQEYRYHEVTLDVIVSGYCDPCWSALHPGQIAP